MAVFYVPHPQEAPIGFEKWFTPFGMGPSAAKDLARKLSLTKPMGPIIILGSAGGLKPELKAGQCFVVNKIVSSEGKNISLNIPRSIEFLPQASLTSVEKPVTEVEKKIALGKSSACDLVDCEMAYLWDEISDDLKEHLLFIRGVLDPATESLNFLEDFQIRWQSLLKPSNTLSFIKFVRHFFKYQRSMKEFFVRVADSMMLKEETEITNIYR